MGLVLSQWEMSKLLCVNNDHVMFSQLLSPSFRPWLGLSFHLYQAHTTAFLSCLTYAVCLLCVLNSELSIPRPTNLRDGDAVSMTVALHVTYSWLGCTTAS
jgi:hypothetical protein